MTLRQLLGLHPLSPELAQHIALLSNQTPTPQVKSYPDAVYFNYFSIGLSLLFSPGKGYRLTTGLKLYELENDKLVLESIYVYNVPPKNAFNHRSKGTSLHTAETAYSVYPDFPLALVLTADTKQQDGKPIHRPPKLDIFAETSGKDFVQALGEPDRKGGGAGPSSGSIGIWCEWSRDGIMVEFGGDDAKGPQAWERGKDAVWKIITLFSPTIS